MLTRASWQGTVGMYASKGCCSYIQVLRCVLRDAALRDDTIAWGLCLV
jgi:hypothetical protein